MTQHTSDHGSHTPGPWRVQGVSVKESSGPDTLAKTFGANAEANARLIAAAPETAVERDRLKVVNAMLLEALEDLLDLGRSGFILGTDIAVTRSVEQARAAIRAARDSA